MLTFRYLIVLKLFFPTITCTHTHTEFCWCNAEWLPPHDKVKLFITTVHKIGQLPIYIYFSPKRTECVNSDDVFWRIVNSIAKQNTLLNVCVCNVYIFIFIQRIAVQLCLCVWKNRMRSQRFPAKVIKHKTNLFIFQLEFSHLMISYAEAAASKAFAFYISFSYRSIFFSSSSLWLGWISLNSSQDDLMTQKNGTSTKKNYEYNCLLALFYFVANNLCVCVLKIYDHFWMSCEPDINSFMKFLLFVVWFVCSFVFFEQCKWHLWIGNVSISWSHLFLEIYLCYSIFELYSVSVPINS